METTFTLIGYIPVSGGMKHRVWFMTGKPSMTVHDAIRALHKHEPNAEVIAAYPGKKTSIVTGVEDSKGKNIQYTFHITLYVD